FLYLGAMTDSYDFQTLFEAVKILQTTSPGFEIHFAGSGPLEEPLKQQVKDLQLEDKIHFHGFLSLKEMEALCGQCHVGLNIIRDGLHITMPHKLNDYLCAGLDVISSLPGESAELLETYKAGVLYTAGDPQGLAVAMQRYLETKNAPQGGALKLAAERLDREKSYPVWGRWLVN
ncbi:MAG: glycosyltransferase, partial [Kiritimatiellia bacterium]